MRIRALRRKAWVPGTGLLLYFGNCIGNNLYLLIIKVLFLTLQVFVKVKLSGAGNHFVLQEILDGLKLTLVKFQTMCIVAGCDYLDNVRGIGIERAYVRWPIRLTHKHKSKTQ